MRTLHPCQFNFQDQDIRRVGSTVDGGTSLSGIRDDIETTGGGYWMAEFTNGRTRTREAGLAWRAITDGLDGGAAAINLLFCERLFQPIGPAALVPHDDETPFSDDSEYQSGGAEYTAAAAALRATGLTIAGVSELPLIGGERFTIAHPNWGCRAYSIIGIDGDQITIRPPLREAVADGTPLDFDDVRCQMRLAQATGNPTNMGRYTSCNLTLIEDMRKPA
jgi:hypothetical protein